MRAAICLLLLCSCLLGSFDTGQATLQFAGQVNALGCPLTLYLQSSSSNAFLAPAFCILNVRELRSSICPRHDRLKNVFYLSVPLALTDSSLLAEARKLVSRKLPGRKLEFLSPFLVRILALVPFVWESGQETGQLQIPCANQYCTDELDQLTGDDGSKTWQEVKFLYQAPVVLEPGLLITLGSRLSLANTSYLPGMRASDGDMTQVENFPACTDLMLAMSFVDDVGACRVSVYRRMSEPAEPAELFIEPLLCYQGHRVAKLDDRKEKYAVDVFLEIESDRVRESVMRRIPSGTPPVAFMELVGLEAVIMPFSLPLRIDEPPRLLPGGKVAVLRISAATKSGLRLLTDVLRDSPADLWQHVTWSVKSAVKYQCMRQSQKLAHAPYAPESCPASSLFHKRTGNLCINREYIEEVSTTSSAICATKCNATQKCQAFSLADGSCKLFKFDKCSKNVRSCSSCDNTGQVFIKKQVGLPPGELCPPGYNRSRYCGVRYRLFPETRHFQSSRNKCESETGLVIMADVMDREEMRVVDELCSNRRTGTFLGGFQRPGSREPDGGWYWVSCSLPVSDSLWNSPEPNNNDRDGKNQNAIIRWVDESGLSDHPETTDYAGGVLCECVSPFD